MQYKLYTLVDITSTGHYRYEYGKEHLRWKEQNFQTVLQTLGMRANIVYRNKPDVVEVRGKLVGFDTDDILRVWRFDFATERDYPLGTEDDPVLYLKQDFFGVPYIQGLDELMDQKHAVFNPYAPGNNIVFFVKS